MMKDAQLNDVDFMELVNKHPNIKARMETILMIAEASFSGLITADDVEAQVRDNVRDLGKHTIENWATSQERVLSAEFSKSKKVKKHSKKNSTGTPRLVK
jgi:hypothetical protein